MLTFSNRFHVLIKKDCLGIQWDTSTFNVLTARIRLTKFRFWFLNQALYWTPLFGTLCPRTWTDPWTNRIRRIQRFSDLSGISGTKTRSSFSFNPSDTKSWPSQKLFFGTPKVCLLFKRFEEFRDKEHKRLWKNIKNE